MNPSDIDWDFAEGQCATLVRCLNSTAAASEEFLRQARIQHRPEYVPEEWEFARLAPMAVDCVDKLVDASGWLASVRECLGAERFSMGWSPYFLHHRQLGNPYTVDPFYGYYAEWERWDEHFENYLLPAARELLNAVRGEWVNDVALRNTTYWVVKVYRSWYAIASILFYRYLGIRRIEDHVKVQIEWRKYA